MRSPWYWTWSLLLLLVLLPWTPILIIAWLHSPLPGGEAWQSVAFIARCAATGPHDEVWLALTCLLLLTALRLARCVSRIRFRRGILVVLVVCSQFVLARASLPLLELVVLDRLDRRSATLIDAIERYAARHGEAPAQLESLVPEYLPVIPSTGWSLAPEWGYTPPRQIWTWSDGTSIAISRQGVCLQPAFDGGFRPTGRTVAAYDHLGKPSRVKDLPDWGLSMTSGAFPGDIYADGDPKPPEVPYRRHGRWTFVPCSVFYRR